MKHNLQYPRRAAALLVALLLLTGCWDNHEMDGLFIVTGVALDTAEEQNQVSLTMEIGKAKSQSGEEEKGKKSSSIMLGTTANSVLEGIMEVNRNSSRTLFLQHNQLILMGEDFAKQGVKDRIDLFMRDQEARMEVLVMVAEGKAGDVLSAKVEQEEITSMYLSRVMHDHSATSPYYRTRMLDFASRVLHETSAPVAPLVTLVQKDDQEEIEVTGMAVFKEDKMVGKLDSKQVQGYVWGMGKVGRSSMIAKSQFGSAVYRVDKLNTKQEVTFGADNQVELTMKVKVQLAIGELTGFTEMSPLEAMPILEEMARKQIISQITESFDLAQELKTDIYELGTSIYRKHPKQWLQIKDRWDQVFANIPLTVEVEVDMPATGQIVKSLEMEGTTP